MSAPLNSTLDAILALERAPSILKVKESLRLAVERHGYTTFLCAAPPQPQEQGNPILIDEWPGEWRQRYVARRYYAHDPMLGELYRTAAPFLWSEVMARRACSEDALLVMSEAADFGMSNGFVVPIYGIGGRLHAVTMTGAQPRTDSHARAELHLVSIYAYARAKQLRRSTGGMPVSLKPREREALQWAAAGKSDWEIGEILAISESAAHKRIEGAKRKLGVATRVQAVVEAIRQGQIQL